MARLAILPKLNSSSSYTPTISSTRGMKSSSLFSHTRAKLSLVLEIVLMSMFGSLSSSISTAAAR
eukprot:CAMPEP_0172037074 /NCGR_PEP_ID=MMETSP1041-20130122/22531_1 /TAXON_ID=464988 /ORGANISM="Hemiselmis andersenii, Strain CCMP439" /LENGTH=64 /DNA_ID=CAMNT_0012694401 /DNA_START=144 /DNA_END=338 /DNA_ORIENTATION=+